jgi:hypothetical protein
MYIHYAMMFLGFVLAQLLITSIMVYHYQKEKSISYGAALTAYLKAEVGYFIIGIIGILVILFIISDYVDLSITRKDLLTKGGLTWKENLRLYFKSLSILVGGFVQYIAFVYNKKGKIAIDKIADKIV